MKLPTSTSFWQKGLILILMTGTACGKKSETVSLPPIKVNVVKAVQDNVPIYEEFVAQTFGMSDVDIHDHTIVGGVTINDTILHIAQENLPFGGIGPSGMGHYHHFQLWRKFSTTLILLKP